MTSVRATLIAIALLCLAPLSQPRLVAASAGSVYLSGPAIGGGPLGLRLPIESFQQRRFVGTLAQQHDFSCGSAALATLLTFNYKVAVSEADVFDDMYKNGDKSVISESGFSLLDMKNYLARNKIASEGFRASLDKLQDVGLPAIVLITVRGYNHFVIVEGIRDGRVLISDPAVGSRSESIARFEGEWGGVFFLILNNVDEAQATFNDRQRWAMAPQLPLNLARFALDQITLARPALLTPGRF